MFHYRAGVASLAGLLDNPQRSFMFVAALLAVAGTALAQNVAGGLKVQTSSKTGLASFVTAADGGAIPVQAAGRAAPEPMDFLLEHGHLFGVTDPLNQLTVQKTESDALGYTHTTYRQVHQGVRVFGGTLKVHQDAAGRFTAANGDFFPNVFKVRTTPALTAGQTEGIAAAAIDDGMPEVEQSELVIVDPGWYGDPAIGARLAYYIVLSDTEAGVREGFFVDALDGRILDQWTMIHTARNRRIHDADDEYVLPGPLARGEGDPGIVGNYDVNAAYDYYGDTYDYYFRAFGRDSIDDRGMAMVATVDSPLPGCPNAFWSGQLRQMVFCRGLVLDDVVGHELTHGVTEFTASLIYQNQSGQLNESFSDVFGELIDLFNGDAAFVGTNGTPPLWPPHVTGPGTDAPNNRRTTLCGKIPLPTGVFPDGVRWLIGEDETTSVDDGTFIWFNGAIRDMWQPPCESEICFQSPQGPRCARSPGDPDSANRVNFPSQNCGNGGDNGGVHSGSGIPNHAFAMVTDGKTFLPDGGHTTYTVNGIGPIKSGAVWYRGLTEYLTELSDFEDAYHALNQAAADLVGTSPNDPRTGQPSSSVFTAADAAELDKALKAVEMNGPGRCGTAIDVLKTEPPTLCPSGRPPIFAEDFETGAGAWSVAVAGSPPTPYFWQWRGGLPLGRFGKAIFCEDPDLGDCFGQNESATHYLLSPQISMPSNLAAPTLSFIHYLNTEVGWDGGDLEIFVVASPRPPVESDWVKVKRSDFLYNAYNTLVYSNEDSASEGLDGWSGRGGWGTSVVNLSGFNVGGKWIQFRFSFSKDGCTGFDGWYVDDVHVFDCDCNSNGVRDDLDVAGGTSRDCQSNGVPDECDLAGGGSTDCQPNGTPDECDGGCAPPGGGGGGTDTCPNDPAKTAPGQCGCGIADTDTDADGTANCLDTCPNDTTVKKSGPGICGCGVSDADSDSDAVPDCNDQCPNARDADSDADGLLDCDDLCPFDVDKSEPGDCGCGEAETDGDRDGTADCRDLCPENAGKASPGVCGCDVAETDSDADGVPNCVDQSAGGLPQALLIEGESDTVTAGDTVKFSALIQYAGGGTEDVSERVAWRVMDTVLASGGGGLFAGDAIAADGTLTVSADRDHETTLALTASFQDGTSELRASRRVRVLVEEAAATPEPPVDGGTGEEPTGQGTGSVGGGSGAPCAVGLVTPMAFAFLVLGFVKRSRRNLSPRRTRRNAEGG